MSAGRKRLRWGVRLLLKTSRISLVSKPHTEVIEADGSYALREAPEAYELEFATENEALRTPSFWNETVDEVKRWLGPTPRKVTDRKTRFFYTAPSFQKGGELADAHGELKIDGKLSAEHQCIAPRSPLGRTTYCGDGVIQNIEI